MDSKIAELIGIVIGDDYLDNCQNHYRICIAGHPVNDLKYFQHIQELIRQVWNKEIKIKEKGRGIYLIINSKSAFLQLAKDLPIGKGKCEKVCIPKHFLDNWELARHVIRGIVDTDGSIFYSNKPGSPNYPSIEITTCSLKLAEQLKSILSIQNFRVAKIWNYKSKMSKRICYKVPLNGKRNVKLWLEKIGFSNPIKNRKANLALTHS